MTKDVISLTIKDLSGFTKALRAEMADAPGQLDMLGRVARAAGYRNYQHLRARNTPTPQADEARVARALRVFDADGFMHRWPARTQIQALCLWTIWAQLPPRMPMNERAISAELDRLTRLNDAAQLRRGLIEHRLVNRSRDGSVYERVEQPLPPEASALISALKARRL